MYITLPPMYGHESMNRRDVVLKLNKSLYGLVQAPRCWYDKISSELSELGFKVSSFDQCLFYKDNIAALVYVDDVIFFGKDLKRIDSIINKLKSKDLPSTLTQDSP